MGPGAGGWLVTRRDLCIEVMRDARRFTVDDPRFSTAQVVGPSMLSLDGDEHRRHRDPFARRVPRPELDRVRRAGRCARRAGWSTHSRRRAVPRSGATSPGRSRSTSSRAAWTRSTSSRRWSSAGTTRSSPRWTASRPAARSVRPPAAVEALGDRVTAAITAATACWPRRGRHSPRLKSSRTPQS